MNLNCLISKEPIQESIKLPCNHEYDYVYLYEEIKVQKQRHKNYFKCPYCRQQFFSTIPYYEIDDVEMIYNVNNNPRNVLNIHKCSHTNCVKSANKYKHGFFCNKHSSNVVSCSATCATGKPCKNKIKVDQLCNLHYKKANKNNVIINTNE
jgi:hypothetical protein